MEILGARRLCKSEFRWNLLFKLNVCCFWKAPGVSLISWSKDELLVTAFED